MKFKALINFKSREFEGTQYVKDMTYTIRAGNKKLLSMYAKWERATLFVPLKDISFLNMEFKKGIVSYCIDDEFLTVVNKWVADGSAELTEGKMVEEYTGDEVSSLNAIGE